MREPYSVLVEIAENYADHQSWRCQYVADWVDGRCPCGLSELLELVGLEIQQPTLGPDRP